MTPETAANLENMMHEYSLCMCKASLWQMIVIDAVQHKLIADDSAIQRIAQRIRSGEFNETSAAMLPIMQDAIPEVMREMRQMLAENP